MALVPAALAGNGRAITPDQLAKLPLILYEAGANTRTIVDDWFRRAGPLPRPIMELGSVEAIKGLVASGLGATVLPSLAIAEAVPGTAVLPLRPALARRLGVVVRRDKVRDRGLRVLLDALAALKAPSRPPKAGFPPPLAGEG